MRFFPRYHSRQVDAEGCAMDTYVVIDASTNEPVTPPLPYHAANDYAGARNNPTQTEEPVGVFAPGWYAAIGTTPITPFADLIGGWGRTSAGTLVRYADDASFDVEVYDPASGAWRLFTP